jgi:hypothetical protein
MMRSLLRLRQVEANTARSESVHALQLGIVDGRVNYDNSACAWAKCDQCILVPMRFCSAR